MASSLLALLTQHTPDLQTRKALIVLGLQNDFLSPEGKLPVDLDSGFLERIKSLVPSFREYGDIFWVRSIASPGKDADGYRGDNSDTVITGFSTVHDGTGTIKSGAKRGVVDDYTSVVKRIKAGPDELDPEIFLSATATREACCICDTWGADHPADVKLLMEKKDVHVVKKSYSAFASTSLLTTLRMRLITELYICGCMTNLSVYATAMDAATHGIQITLVEDALGFRDRVRHNEAIRQLRDVMSADVMTKDKIIDRLCNAFTSEEEEYGPSEDEENAAQAGALSRVSHDKIPSVTSVFEANDSLAADSEDDEGEIELPQHPQPASVGAAASATHDTFAADVVDGLHADDYTREDLPVIYADHFEPKIELTSDRCVKEEPLGSPTDEEQPEGLPTGHSCESNALEASNADDGYDAAPGCESQEVEPRRNHQDTDSSDELPLANRIAEGEEVRIESHTDTVELGQSQQNLEDRPGLTGSRDPLQESRADQLDATPQSGEQVAKAMPSRIDVAQIHNAVTNHDSFASTKSVESILPRARLSNTETSEVSEIVCPTPALEGVARDGVISTQHESRPLLGDEKEVESAGSRIYFALLPPELSETIFDILHKEVDWQTMHHQTGQVPRLVCCQGSRSEDGSWPVYRHPSDETMPLQPWSVTVKMVQDAAEKLVGHPLNHALIQLYRGGTDYISEHSDKTLDIAKGSYIVNVSFGAQRTMRLRTKRAVQDTISKDAAPAQRTSHRIIMPHNSCITMSLATNAEYLHGINADKRPSVELCDAEKAYDGQRISLTFRHIATFLSADEKKIWGQGATAKREVEARAVINADVVESGRLIRRFGAENQASSIDWEAVYGGGSDVLHMR
ncbi:hypothetical protein LTR78_001282 [Recurvomyces mirabilis]|uniref:Fe2OG dioxygenase domain-containing protein n=1 Tax=Recurvomyces mirabilis TaxID=574656 RepID=A0AAE0WVX3_9PEZI|nr:hypothetical protein LTR78_001282 [Recurvomyces mirabilis]KAK5161259.1 hypothetical protein LTS14_001055 [Recurvomyces mirabilis]